jgi:alkanesulfonate monooxygenase SsuD/methylene tetrahydromethanopterin reductase-like flavin-dependent oxidoreductase (luciferase family)
MELGVQIHLPSFPEPSVAAITEIGRAAVSAGFGQIWVTDNLECPNLFVILAALASIDSVKLGTAIMAQYFRSPVEAATALVPVSELMGGRELCVGLGTGNPHTGRSIDMPRPVGFMRQTARCLRELLDGQRVDIDAYPLLSDYFNFAPGARLHVTARPAGPILLYGGGNGPLGLALAGAELDGVIFGPPTTLPGIALGTLAGRVSLAETAAMRAGRAEPLRKVAELKISIAPDHDAARHFVRSGSSCPARTVAFRRRGGSDDDLRRLGIDPVDVDRLERVVRSEGPTTDLAEAVTDAMIDASYIAGDPDHCRSRLVLFAETAREHGFEQIIFSELGPDPAEAMALIADLWPDVRG